MTLACLASQSCTELGPAQPQLVLSIIIVLTVVVFKPFIVETNLNIQICFKIDFQASESLARGFSYGHTLFCLEPPSLINSPHKILPPCRLS